MSLLGDSRVSSPKRKLDDYTSSHGGVCDGDDLSAAFRMRKLDPSPADYKGKSVADSDCYYGGSSFFVGESSQLNSCSRSMKVRFFVRMITNGYSLTVNANLEDTVEEVQKKIQRLTGIPLMEQRIIYMGKQLPCEQTLGQCGIQKDSVLHLVGRMRSTGQPRAWSLVGDLVSLVIRVCKKETLVPNICVKEIMEEYIRWRPKSSAHVSVSHSVRADSRVLEYYKIFMDACAPDVLVALYMSNDKTDKDCADDCIRCLINSVPSSDRPERAYFTRIMLEFCRLLMTTDDDPLYVLCRKTLGSLLQDAEVVRGGGGVGYYSLCIDVQEIMPIFKEVAGRVTKDLVLSYESNATTGPMLQDVSDFSAFLHPLHEFIKSGSPRRHPISGKGLFGLVNEEVEFLYDIFTAMFSWIGQCLDKMEECLTTERKKEVEIFRSGWSQYLTILKELHRISELYEGAEDQFWTMLKCRKVSVRALLVRYAKHDEDHDWLIRHKDMLDYESRRHLAMLMFPKGIEDYEEIHEMLIDRSQLLAESFEYVSHADPSSLHAGLFVEFKNEDATGPGVLREWFYLLCQAIFDPQNNLFVTCPLDRRRFFPNATSNVDPLHLHYFRFSGRVIALALMHKVQVGIMLDRAFYLQLAGQLVTLEDIQDADPYMYNSCKQILEMDADFLDSDALGLTFVREVEELGSQQVIELCPGGKDIVVNSKNREEYVSLLIQHCFVKSISEQVSNFATGFADILSCYNFRKLFFQTLELEDLNLMLHGSGNSISIEDWKAHTDYHGYKKSDPQILWFWEAVAQISAEQKSTLLFFWTSVKHLPAEGFRGLASRLVIYKSFESQDRLPSSHTCFYRLYVPPYPSKSVVEDRLHFITQEYIGCSFGTW